MRFRTSFLLFFLLSINFIISGQNHDTIEIIDSVTCEKNLLELRKLNNLKKYDEAIDLWKETYKNCKTYNKRVFIYGVNILSYDIEKKKEINKKRILVDSLMSLYEEQIKYFGQEGFVKGRQGVYLLKYSKNKNNEAYKLLSQSLEFQKLDTEVAVIVSLMQTLEYLYINNKVTKQEVELVYKKCIGNIEDQLKCEKSEFEKEQLKNAHTAINSLFFRYRSIDCDELSNRFNDYYEENKGNAKRLEKLAILLEKNNCYETELYEKVIKKIGYIPRNEVLIEYKAISKEKYELAIKYFKNLAEKEHIDSIKARHYYNLAQFHRELGRLNESKKSIYEAIKLKPNFGAPYIALATMYASASGETKLKNAVNYCAAVDKLKKAKEIDPLVKNVAEKLIGIYSIHFPSKGEIEKQGLKIGQSYHIGGWINETTIVRARK